MALVLTLLLALSAGDAAPADGPDLPFGLWSTMPAEEAMDRVRADMELLPDTTFAVVRARATQWGASWRLTLLFHADALVRLEAVADLGPATNPVRPTGPADPAMQALERSFGKPGSTSGDAADGAPLTCPGEWTRQLEWEGEGTTLSMTLALACGPDLRHPALTASLRMVSPAADAAMRAAGAAALGEPWALRQLGSMLPAAHRKTLRPLLDRCVALHQEAGRDAADGRAACVRDLGVLLGYGDAALQAFAACAGGARSAEALRTCLLPGRAPEK
jgi:hypothetical protein